MPEVYSVTIWTMSSFLYLFKPLKLPAGSRPMISVSCLFKIRAPQGVCAEKERIGGLMEKQAQPAPGSFSCRKSCLNNHFTS